jgi:hypothetical protein
MGKSCQAQATLRSLEAKLAGNYYGATDMLDCDSLAEREGKGTGGKFLELA